VVFFAEAIQALYEFVTFTFKRPKPTLKAVIIYFLTLAFVSGAALYFLDGNYIDPDPFRLMLVLLAFTLILSDINSVAVYCMYPLTLIMKRRALTAARKKVAVFEHLKVIGITGSYGKSTTKEFITQLLSKKYKVLSTQGNVNTEIGVAQTVMNKLKPEHEVFVVEMGAYKRGEIKAICDIVRPTVGVVTGINEQHVGLFGSTEAIMEAKFELLDALPETGLAVCNGDNTFCVEMAAQAKCRKQLYSITFKSDFAGENIAVEPTKVCFTLHAGDKKAEVCCHVVTRHNVLNVLAAVSVALEMGMTFDEIVRELPQLTLPKKTMTVTVHGDTVVIDDTYNTNSDGLRSALVYMKEAYEDYKKIVVFPGIIELGSSADEVHVELGADIAQIADVFIITSVDFAEPLARGARLGHMETDQIIVTEDPEDVEKLIADVSQKKVILFESRGMEAVLNKLKIPNPESKNE
jgi:UDP-N-acetylmuramoyl-tripeptide--D-alanyl-D-alanine ligase